MRVKAMTRIGRDCGDMPPESFMSAKLRLIVPLIGASALVAWIIALNEALPRLMAGPLCSSRQGNWLLAGHCPACWVAAALTTAFMFALLATRAPANALVAAPNA
jgi:hypothetical protein